VLIKSRVQSLGLDRATDNPVVILQEEEGDRELPIWIGPGEASAIGIGLKGMTLSRPLSHDLMASMVGGLGGTVESVAIRRIGETVYGAELRISRDEETVTVDARPSDSIALALRVGADILVDEAILRPRRDRTGEGGPPGEDPGPDPADEPRST
jgi:hypothetical protein